MKYALSNFIEIPLNLRPGNSANLEMGEERREKTTKQSESNKKLSSDLCG